MLGKIWAICFLSALFLVIYLQALDCTTSGIAYSANNSTKRARITTLGLQKSIDVIDGSGRSVLVIQGGKRFKGTYISRISRTSKLYQAGIRPTDIVLAINNLKASTPESLNQLLAENYDRPPLLSYARKKGQFVTIHETSLLNNQRRKRRRAIGIPIGLPIPIRAPIPSFRGKRKHNSNGKDKGDREGEGKETAKDAGKGNGKDNIRGKRVVQDKTTVASTSIGRVPVPEVPKLNNSALKQSIQLEAFMVTLINQERKKHGLRRVKSSRYLANVARMHSQDMIQRNFFSHINPDQMSPSDRTLRAGIKFGFLAENISAENWEAADQILVRRSHKSLMNSKLHRENILDPRMITVGIGIVQKRSGGIVVTQLFASNRVP